MRITLLCGGIGGSKLALGLYHEFPADDLRIIVNTADDLTILGLHISPDLDTVTYTLADLVNEETGWGLAGDTFEGLSMLERYGHEGWFRLGDRDLATHLFRTHARQRGQTLTGVTAAIAKALEVRAAILPMCDQPVATKILADQGWLDFQDYFVRRRHEDRPLGVEYRGVDAARASPQVVEAIRGADVIVVAPSNPVVSIGPILAVPGLLDLLKQSPALKIAVSPIVGTSSVTGPADALMRAMGVEGSVAGVAAIYREWLDVLVLDQSDSDRLEAVEREGVRPSVAPTLMSTLGSKRALARHVIGLS